MMCPPTSPPVSITDLLHQPAPLLVSAPMVRLSRLPFRLLVREYGADLAFTPMIMADSFLRSPLARASEFQTCSRDRPLVVQFAACDPHTLSAAAQLVYGYCDGVDINCGCPQKWAMSEGLGSALLRSPQLIADMVRSVKNVIPDLSVSVKIRLDEGGVEKSVDLCRQVESCGVTFITVHGRTPSQRREPVDVEAIKIIKSSVKVPVIANGDITSLSQVYDVTRRCGVDGVMVARGLLTNPAMFTGCEATPVHVMSRFVELSVLTGCTSPYQTFHRHVEEMLDGVRGVGKAQRLLFNTISSVSAVIDHLRDYYGATWTGMEENGVG